jgi:hypothetical protein
MFAAPPHRKGLVNAARETCHFQTKVARNLQRFLAESIARAVHAPGNMGHLHSGHWCI